MQSTQIKPQNRIPYKRNAVRFSAQSQLFIQPTDMIRRVGVDQSSVVLVDHLGGAVAHLVG